VSFKASGMTPTIAQQMYGFEHMAQRAKKVENCISEAQKIREAIESLATIEDTAFLATLGILSDDSDEESDHTGEVVSRTMCHIEPEVSGGETSLVSTSTEGTRTTSTDAEESEKLQKRDWCEFISKKDGKTKRRHVKCKVCTNHPSVVAMHCHRQ